MKQKKKLIVSEVFFPEDFLINDLTAHWIDRGIDLEILTRVPSYPAGKTFPGFKNGLFQKSKYKGVRVNHIPYVRGYQKRVLFKLLNYLNYMFFSFWYLLFNGRKYDKIFIYQTGPLSNAYSICLLKWLFKWEVIIWSQDLWPETVYAFGVKETKITKAILNRFVGFIYKRCDVILVSCKGFIPRIKKYKKEGKYIWAPNWTLVNHKASSELELKGQFNFTFAGNIGKVQNLDKVLRSFKSISGQNSDVFFNVIGDGSFLEELKSIVKKEEIKNVVFHGRKPLDEMPSYFNASDVLVISLLDSPIYEIMIPSKFQAYLSAKKAIFSIVTGELNSLVNEYNIGVTADSSSLSSIVKGFRELMGLSQIELAEMTRNSEELESKFFDKTKTMDLITTVISNESV